MDPLGTQRLTLATRQRARRVFEATLAQVQQQYAPTADFMVDATLPDATGQPVVVARYKLYVDGRIECFTILDDVLWPPLPGAADGPR